MSLAIAGLPPFVTLPTEVFLSIFFGLGTFVIFLMLIVVSGGKPALVFAMAKLTRTQILFAWCGDRRLLILRNALGKRFAKSVKGLGIFSTSEETSFISQNGVVCTNILPEKAPTLHPSYALLLGNIRHVKNIADRNELETALNQMRAEAIKRLDSKATFKKSASEFQELDAKKKLDPEESLKFAELKVELENMIRVEMAPEAKKFYDAVECDIYGRRVTFRAFHGWMERNTDPVIIENRVMHEVEKRNPKQVNLVNMVGVGMIIFMTMIGVLILLKGLGMF